MPIYRCLLISGVQIRMILLRELIVGRLDFLRGSVAAFKAQILIECPRRSGNDHFLLLLLFLFLARAGM